MKKITGSRRYRLAGPLALAILQTCQVAQAEEEADTNTNKFFISGDFRAGWLNYDYGNPDGIPTINKGNTDSQGFYITPKISLNTPVYYGFSGKVTVAGATDFGINGEDKQSRLFVFDGVEKESFAILQELFIEYNTEEHHLLVGRNEIFTPMIEHDDYYMLANSFGVASYKNTSFDNFGIHVGYFYDMAGVWDSGANGTEFHTMSDASFVPQINKDEAGDEGVYFASVDYNNDTHHAQLWNYYAPDLYNTLFAQYNYMMKTEGVGHDFGVQFIDFSQVGNLKSSDTEIDYNIISLKYDAAFDNGWSLATGAAKYSNGDGQGSTLGAWGGYPYFANGMIFHFFDAGSLRDASSFKIQGGYDFSKTLNTNLALNVRYTYFNLSSDYSISSDGRPQDDMQMIGVQLKHTFLENGYFAATFEHVNLDNEDPIWALNLIGGYRF
ncbi:MAG: hypothetical protein U9Q75_05605 [Pseudomonadota bacterium]|nr:hypothetical protein [Pseudomonadota bacterium]